MRDASTLRTAASGPRGSITTEKVERAEPRSSGARKSLRTSTRGHSATQNVAWSRPSTRSVDQLSSIAMGHGSSSLSVAPVEGTCAS